MSRADDLLRAVVEAQVLELWKYEGHISMTDALRTYGDERARQAESDGQIDGLESAIYAIESESVLGGTKREHMAAVNMRDALARKVRFLLQNARAAAIRGDKRP